VRLIHAIEAYSSFGNDDDNTGPLVRFMYTFQCYLHQYSVGNFCQLLLLNCGKINFRIVL
jgi:hypothetical protein